MTQYYCTICKKPTQPGFTKIHEGMFFKLCEECYEEEEILKMLNEHLVNAMEGEEDDGVEII